MSARRVGYPETGEEAAVVLWEMPRGVEGAVNESRIGRRVTRIGLAMS